MPLAATLIAALGERAGEGSAEKAVDEPTVAAARRQMEADVFIVAVACFAGGEESEESERCDLAKTPWSGGGKVLMACDSDSFPATTPRRPTNVDKGRTYQYPHSQ